jgi:hypothetical protein
MIRFTGQQLKQHRKERELLRIGDRVAVIGPLNRIVVATVKEVMPERITVALTKDSNLEYRIADGGELSDFPVSKLRGPATHKELEALKRSILPKKKGWTVERIASAQARTFRQTGWLQVISENLGHRTDEPGMHVDHGNYANQLRYHDSDGMLRADYCIFEKPELNGNRLRNGIVTGAGTSSRDTS